MRILITNSYYYPAFVGGAEISVKMLAEGLQKAGNQVYVLTTGTENKVYTVNGVIVISVRQQNIYNSYNAGKKPGFLKVLWHLFDSFNFLYHFRVSAILKKVRPDIAHTNSIQGFSPMLWLSIKMQKIPLVHSMRDYYMLCHKCNMYNGKNCESLCAPCATTNSVKRLFFGLPDKLVAISEFILEKYNAYLPIPANKSQIIYNSVNITASPPKKTDQDLAVVTLGYIGRLEEDKGVAYMVNELAALPADEKSQIRLILAGKGGEEFIEKLKAKLTGINYQFLGLAKPEDFYSSIDVLLVPALWNEPFGRIVVESLSYAIPVCQSNRGGLKELFNPASSWLFSPENTQLTAMVSHILANRAEIVKKRNSCFETLHNFSVSNYIDKHTQLYQSLISKTQRNNIPKGSYAFNVKVPQSK